MQSCLSCLKFTDLCLGKVMDNYFSCGCCISDEKQKSLSSLEHELISTETFIGTFDIRSDPRFTFDNT